MSINRIKIIVFLFICGMLATIYFITQKTHSNDWPKLYYNIKNNCKDKKRCTVSLKNVYAFDWDEAYIFSETAEKGYLEKKLNNKLTDYVEFCQSIIFLEGNVIVKELYSGCIPERSLINQNAIVRFKFNDKGVIQVHSQKSELSVSKYTDSDSDHVFYEIFK